MKLIYRGHAYKVSAPVQFGDDSNHQLKTKLIYRGYTYYVTPRSVMVSEPIKPDEATVTLIYRGNTYKRRLQLPKLYQQPRAINWRYQVSEEG